MSDSGSVDRRYLFGGPRHRRGGSASATWPAKGFYPHQGPSSSERMRRGVLCPSSQGSALSIKIRQLASLFGDLLLGKDRCVGRRGNSERSCVHAVYWRQARDCVDVSVGWLALLLYSTLNRSPSRSRVGTTSQIEYFNWSNAITITCSIC